MDNTITLEMVKSQAYKFYLAPLLWALFFLFLPYIYQHSPLWLTLIIIVFPGTFLFSWICYLYHESWHQYVPSIPNHLLYVLYGWLLASDPQVYRIAHGTHHAYTHTWNDIEFHPLGYIKNKHLRHLYNFLEIAIGEVFIYLVTFFVIFKHPRFRWRSVFITLVALFILFGTFYFIDVYLLQVNPGSVILCWFLAFLICGSIQHNSQLIEHAGIIVDEKISPEERNLLTRNLKPSGLLEKIFLFLTHCDSEEHVLHHTKVKFYTRPYLHVIAMPPQAIYITLNDYRKIAWDLITK